MNPPEGIIASPINEDCYDWEALIMGPEGTCFEGGVYTTRLCIPKEYPMKPPTMKFKCEIFHPNIYPDGTVCISILHEPGEDAQDSGSASECWSPVQSIEKILLSVVSLLSEPNCDSPANVDAAKMWREDREQFKKIADLNVRKSLGL